MPKKSNTCSRILNSMKTELKVLKSNETNTLIKIFSALLLAQDTICVFLQNWLLFTHKNH